MPTERPAWWYQAGASRSTTACVAYLMHRHRWTLDHAWGVVAAKHKAANPNVGFQKQLIEYHTQLHGSPQVRRRGWAGEPGGRVGATLAAAG